MEFKDTFKRLRARSGLTQTQMAKALGVTRSAIGNWEAGIREPNKETMEVIADYFNISLDVLMSRQEDTMDGYYTKETRKMAQAIFENNELKLLFDTAMDSDPEDLKTAHDILLALKRKERN